MVDWGEHESPSSDGMGDPGEPEGAASPSPSDSSLTSGFDFPALIAIADTLPVMVAYCDREERYLFINRPLADWFERPREDILGRRIEYVMGSAPYALRKNAISSAMRGEPQVIEAEFEHPSRGRLFTRATYRPHRDKGGEVIGLVMVVENITEHRQSEIHLKAKIAEGSAELADRDARLHAIFDTVQTIIVLMRPDGTILEANDRATLWRPDGSAGEAGKPVWDTPMMLAHPGERDRVRKMVERAARGETVVDEFELAIEGQGTAHLTATLQPITSPDGEVEYILLEARDVSELKFALDQLRQAQKMEALGQLTGGIAHDFNNLLTVVVGGLDMISRRDVDEKTRSYATNALAAAERGARLTGQLLAFSRTQKLEVRPSDVRELVRQSRPLLRNVLRPGIEKKIEVDPALPPVMADPTQLEVALLNLAVNARDAMPSGGTLRISARPVTIEGDAELGDGRYVEIAVSDTGEGMESETLARVFEPFFTTKDVGKGTGLGLSMVYGMARQSGGTARIESSPGAGTTVRILLREADAPVESDAPRKPASAKVRSEQGTSVLVIDDDEAVRAFMVESLRERGYAVTEADNGRRGLRLFAEIEPDIVVVDYVMPGLSGADVASRMLERQPGQAILFVSGYSETEAIRRVAPDATLLAKPFRADALEEAIRALAGRE